MSNRKTERRLWYYFIYTINILISTMSVCVLWFWEAVFPNACVPWLQVTAPSVGFFLSTTLVTKITPVNGLHTDPSCSWLTPCGAVPAQKMLDLFICWQSYSEQPWQAVRHINNVFALNLQMNWNMDFRCIGMTWLFWWLAVISYTIEVYRKQSRKFFYF